MSWRSRFTSFKRFDYIPLYQELARKQEKFLTRSDVQLRQ
tara:strand:- start:162 stop:281 length:120 start_codon:yes stop_codon:yes gene_type:complete